MTQQQKQTPHRALAPQPEAAVQHSRLQSASGVSHSALQSLNTLSFSLARLKSTGITSGAAMLRSGLHSTSDTTQRVCESPGTLLDLAGIKLARDLPMRWCACTQVCATNKQF